jgi:putative nucleotidyltransferase with HDIG domain
MALSARVLRLVNSASFALRTPCTSMRQATSLVGTEKLNHLATTAAILDMVDSSSVHASRILEHSSVVGALSRYLAVHLGLPADELFTCGFLHDIGKLMLLEVEGKRYGALLDEVGEEYDAIHLYERELFGFDHALLAGHVLQKWNIPEPVPRVVAWHHHVTRAYDQGPRWASLVSVLRLADLLAYALTSPDDEEQVERAARSEAASFLEISAAQLAAVWDELRAINERSRALFRGEEPPESRTPLSLRPSARSFRPSRSLGLSGSHPSLQPLPHASFHPRPGPSRGAQVGLGTASSGAQSRVASVRDVEQRPKQFPCVVCDGPTFAHECPACHGMVCPEHSKGVEEWCVLCWEDYRTDSARFKLRPILTLIAAAGVGATLVSALFAFLSSGEGPGLRAIVGPLSGTVIVAGLVAILHRYVQRAWFLRHRPDRRHAGLAPPSPREEEEQRDSGVRQTSEVAPAGADQAVTEGVPTGAEAVPTLRPPAAALATRGTPAAQPPVEAAAQPPVEAPAVEAAALHSVQAQANATSVAMAPSAPQPGAGIAVLPRIALVPSSPEATPSWPLSLVPPGSREAEERDKVLRLLGGVEGTRGKEPIIDSPGSFPVITVRPLFGGASVPPEQVRALLSVAPTLTGVAVVAADGPQTPRPEDLTCETESPLSLQPRPENVDVPVGEPGGEGLLPTVPIASWDPLQGWRSLLPGRSAQL